MGFEWKEVLDTDILETTVTQSDGTGQSEMPVLFGESDAKASRKFHQCIDGYEKTPLVSLQELAKELNVKRIYVKDESKRFSLNAFKGLGGSYAMFRILCEKFDLDPEKTTLQNLMQDGIREQVAEVTFATATDGNHGRGVSWAAGILGCQVHVYMPAGSVEIRADAIRKVGPAEVTITEMNYDDTVSFAAAQSRKYGWHLIQDTAWDGYEKIPAWIIQGYLTMVDEAAEQLDAENIIPTHVFLQAGVGAMAGGVLGYLTNRYKDCKLVTAIVEPNVANCIYISAKSEDGIMQSVDGMPSTIMAGLNCGTPCKITWPILRDYAEYYLSCPDFVAAHGMRVYANPLKNDSVIVSGESGAATMGALCLLLQRREFQEVRERMGLGAESVVLLINTEGDTDPEGYQSIVQKGKYPLPK